MAFEGNQAAELLIGNIEWISGDFPGGLVVTNPPYDSGYTGSIPGPGTKIPQATCHRAIKPTYHN